MGGQAKRILILFAHPALERSRVNRVLADEIAGLESITFHDLYEAYPDFDIDIKREQALLLDHDIIVFQHPLYWYSTPALIKQWEDLVLQHGWAYGTRGTALYGKKVMSAITAGGGEDAYQHEGFHRATIDELLLPIRKTANLCGMEYLPPFVVYGALGMATDDARHKAHEYRQALEKLSSG
ncbi:MAG: NAD(P)H-dependent oxidoreductase [Polyangiales bacterium]